MGTKPSQSGILRGSLLGQEEDYLNRERTHGWRFCLKELGLSVFSIKAHRGGVVSGGVLSVGVKAGH